MTYPFSTECCMWFKDEYAIDENSDGFTIIISGEYTYDGDGYHTPRERSMEVLEVTFAEECFVDGLHFNAGDEVTEEFIAKYSDGTYSMDNPDISIVNGKIFYDTYRFYY